MASKLYVDLNGLKEFKDKLTAAYAANSAESFVVNYAKNAGNADFATKDASGNVITATYVPVTRTVAGLGLDANIGAADLRGAVTLIDGVSFKGSRDSAFADLTIEGKKAKLDLSAYALKEDVTSATAFKGVVDYAKDLPTTGNKAGDIYFVRYAGESGTKALNAEYIWIPADTEKGVTAHWEELGPIVDLSAYKVWEETKSYIDGEISKEATARDNAISTAIGNLDATVGSASVAEGKHVAVQVVEADGVLTGLTVTENDIASAAALTAEITRAQNAEGALETDYKAADDKIVEDYEAADAQVLVDAKAYADTKKTEAIEAANANTATVVAGLDATVGGTTIESGKHVNVQVVETDGKLNGLTVTENDIASAAALEQEVLDRNAAIEDAIEALDAEKSQVAGADGLALSITEVDGKITAISGSIAANTYDAHGAADDALVAAKGYTDAEIQKLDVDEISGDYLVAVSETNGKISATAGTKGSITASNTGLVDGGTVKTYVDGKFDDIDRVTEAQIDGLFA